MKILSVVGARPQFVKLSPIDRALKKASHEHVIVHTGQHYDTELSDSLFEDLDIPTPDVNLGIGSGSHAEQTARMLVGLEGIFEEQRPDWVLVYGDTNSTLAAAIAAVKLQLPIAHLEAGLRSGNRLMPEEHNRIVTDHVADLLLAPTESAMLHLASEGLAARSRNVGDVMVDVCYRVRDVVREQAPAMPSGWNDSGDTILATIHRAENTNGGGRLEEVLSGLNAIGRMIFLVAHPRLIAKAAEFGLPLEREWITPITSMAYSQMVHAVDRALGVITDSGGLQKEAFLLGTPCVTVRTETEWPETLSDDWNIIDPQLTGDLMAHFSRVRTKPRLNYFGNGFAAEAAVGVLETFAPVA